VTPPFTIDVRVAELLASRLCHDLVGPVGAVNNGLELMADDQLGMADDALDLATKSAERASEILLFFRMAYGMSGSRQGDDAESLRAMAAGYLSYHKASLDWPNGEAAGTWPDGVGKLILNMVALAAEALPRGGTVEVAVLSVPAGTQVEVRASGVGAGLRVEVGEGLEDDVPVEQLTPYNVHAYFTRIMANRLGGDLLAEPDGEDRFRLAVAIPG